ncbi:MAG TPA: BTAD domain-containing putative transcriptional regulator [Roseiflexaceae bacterium]|nr:BTAD domain-containing putative transcriptional regulator [Roseiflexaceae bacterium]
MSGDTAIVHTRLIPPRLPQRWLRRPRLDHLLAAAAEHPLTIVHASAGYGKSSALASLAARGGWPTAWLSLDAAIDDPHLFLLHLTHACRTVAPHTGLRTVELLERAGPALVWNQALDALLNDLVAALDDETILVLDDYHTVDERADLRALIERLILQRPHLLHVVLVTRQWPQIACLPTLLVRGELFEVGEADLLFTDEEIAELFASAYDHTLSPSEATSLHAQSGGWAIALQLLGQSARERSRETGRRAREHGRPGSVTALHPSAGNQESLFAYLAQDVLARQPAAIQTFLLRSSVLAELDPAACDAVLQTDDALAQLRALERRGLFLTAQGDQTYRYHPLFHAFLQQHARARLPDWAALHARAADFYRVVGADEQMLAHLAELNDHTRLADELERLAPRWLEAGRLVTLSAWLDRLPPALIGQRGALLLARGDAARMQASFGVALDAYTQAEQRAAAEGDSAGQAHALRGEALVYLDTLQPARAEHLLRRAFKLLPREQRAERSALLALLAENRLNSGRAAQAERLYHVARRLAPESTPAEPQPRLLIRLGRLGEARALLAARLPEVQAALERGSQPEAHRDITLLLALVCLFQGDHAAARRYAQQGMEIARQHGSPLAEAVAHIRLGHALQISPEPDLVAANQHYLQAMILADTFHVQRTKANAYMGLVLLHGFSGDLAAARAAAHEGLSTIERSGDAWTAARLWTALGAVGVAGGDAEAESWLQAALRRYRVCRDTYGQALVQLWQTIALHRAGQAEAAAHQARALLALVRQHGYDGLLSSVTLLGPRDRMMLVPVLLAGRSDPAQAREAQRLLAQGFPAISADDTAGSYHPGSTLRVALFERLRVWRGAEEIEARAWQRKKAHQLLALLLTNRHRWLLREQICEMLWPDEERVDAEAQFKVTLNALNAALEPARPPRTPPFYVRRQGSAYRFCPTDGLWLDVEEFERRIDAARAQRDQGTPDSLAAARDTLLGAVGLYGGDFLSEYLYEEWAREERERLATAYLEAATTLADLLLRSSQIHEAVRLCESILARDPSWEQAYVTLMGAYAQQGNRRLALATYDRCVRNLRSLLDVAPLPQTTKIYETVRG